jgi:hypothetical protein
MVFTNTHFLAQSIYRIGKGTFEHAAASVTLGSKPPFAAPRIKVCYGPVVSLDIIGVSGSAKVFQKPLFLEQT